jgi:WD40 repeat protein
LFPKKSTFELAASGAARGKIMADVKISGLPAASSVTGAMEFEVNDGGSSKKATGDQIQDKVIGTTNGLIARTAANTVAARTLTAGAGIIVSNGNGVAGNPTVTLDPDAIPSSFEIGDTLTTARNPGAGWLEANGGLKSTTSYAALYAVIGDDYAPITYPFKLVKQSIPGAGTSSLFTGASWNPNGRYFCTSQEDNPRIQVWKFAKGVASKLSDPNTMPPGSAYDAEWSPTGQHIAVAHNASPFISFYQFDETSETLSKIANPASLPAGQGNGVSWSPDGLTLAIALNVSPFVAVYDFTTGSPVKMSDPATLPAGASQSVSWSPDGRYLSVAHLVTPFVTIYDFKTGVPVKIANPAALPAGDGYSVAWSPSGRWMSVGHNTTPFLSTYDWTSGVPIKAANPAPVPTSTCYSLGWDPSSRFLAAGTGASSSNAIGIYDMSSGSPVRITAGVTDITNNIRSLAFSPSGRDLIAINRDSFNAGMFNLRVTPPSGVFYLPRLGLEGSLRTYIKAA